MIILDGNATLDTIGRREDSSDGNISSPDLAERAVIKSIGNIEAIDTVYLDVALTRKGAARQRYSF